MWRHPGAAANYRKSGSYYGNPRRCAQTCSRLKRNRARKGWIRNLTLSPPPTASAIPGSRCQRVTFKTRPFDAGNISCARVARSSGLWSGPDSRLKRDFNHQKTLGVGLGGMAAPPLVEVVARRRDRCVQTWMYFLKLRKCRSRPPMVGRAIWEIPHRPLPIQRA